MFRVSSCLACFTTLDRSVRGMSMLLCGFFTNNVSSFWIQLSYFLPIALFGSLALMILKPSDASFNPHYIDMLYLSTSALTVSGFANVEMEVLSSGQIAVLTLLMLLGGEVFVSFLGIILRKGKNVKSISNSTVDDSFINIEMVSSPVNQIESQQDIFTDGKYLKHNSIEYLGFVILGYIIVFHVVGTVITLIYVSLVSSARNLLNRKGINKLLFSVSVTVSAFSNSGLMPTNENMVVFKENSGLLLLTILLIMAGNTLFPLFLSLVIWVLRNLIGGREFDEMWWNPREIGFDYFLPRLQTAMLSVTVVGFVLVQVVVFWIMDWNSEVFDGLDSGQKFVNGFFMAVNTRQAGESTVNLSMVSPAVLVLFTVMMYLPSSTSVRFRRTEEDDNASKTDGRVHRLQDIILPQIPCNVIFVMAICITEGKKLSRDPQNFSIFNIVFEVISAYGNVGLSMGYSCKQQLQPAGSCEDKSYGFSGWWSDEGKLILTIVMLYGRLKKFTSRNGKA